MTKTDILRIFRDSWVSSEWNFFATLTFRDCLDFVEADEIFKKWIDEMQQEDGSMRFYWDRIIPWVIFPDEIRFYVLVRGMKSGSKHYWVYRWQQLAGDAFIDYPACCGGALRYLKKNLPSGVEFGMNYLGWEFER